MSNDVVVRQMYGTESLADRLFMYCNSDVQYQLGRGHLPGTGLEYEKPTWAG